MIQYTNYILHHSFRVKKFLTREDLQLDWKPLYKTVHEVFFGKDVNNALMLVPSYATKYFFNHVLPWQRTGHVVSLIYSYTFLNT